MAEETVKTRLRDLQAAVDTAFVDAWDDLTAQRKVLVTLDPFEAVAATELGSWLVHLSLRLPRTLTLLARVPSGDDVVLDSPRLRRVDLPNFDLAVVEDYLERVFAGETLRPGLARVVHDYTDGHPGGTALAAKLIREHDRDLDARSLRRILDRLPEDPQQRWGKLVRFIVEAVHEPLLKEAVDAAAIVRSFDEPLLAALLSLGDEEGAGRAVSALHEHRLTQPVAWDVRPDRFRLVEFIRLALADDVRRNRPATWRRLHGRAAQHLFGELQKDEAAYAGNAYQQWYRYERPEWQADERDWLHHSGLLPDRRETTRARFVLVWLEAFWWWGCYHDFDFTHLLLDDWERATAGWEGSADNEAVKDQQLADALRFVLDNYPLGHVKPASAPWDQMQSKLQLVRALCGLAPGARLPSQEEERTQAARARALLRVFLAHTRRFRDPHDPAAMKHYGQALSTFRQQGERWVVAWLLFETADLALEAGDVSAAVERLRSAAEELRAASTPEDGNAPADAEDDDTGEWDYELLADLHRARADAHWRCGELEAAAAEYGEAVAAAYWFQGQEHPPDPYTHRFYEEITTRSADRVLELPPGDEVRARFLRALLAPVPGSPRDMTTALTTDDPAAVVAALFPPGPDPTTELGSAATTFMTLWWERCEDREDPARALSRLIG